MFINGIYTNKQLSIKDIIIDLINEKLGYA